MSAITSVFDILSEELGNGVTVVQLAGEVDAFNASEFRAAMGTAASAPRLVVDLAGLAFVDSAGLGVLINTVRRVNDSGGQMVLAAPRPALGIILRDTGLLRLVPLAETVDDAIKLLSEPDAESVQA